MLGSFCHGQAEDAQLSAVCSGLRRAAHAGALATEAADEGTSRFCSVLKR